MDPKQFDKSTSSGSGKENKPNWLAQTVGIVAAIIGALVGRYVGLALLIPFAIGGLVGFVAYKCVSQQRKPIALPFGILVGHACTMVIAAMILNWRLEVPVLFVLMIVVMIGGGIWFLLLPGIAPAILLTIYESICLTVETVEIFGINFGTDVHKGILTNIFLRIAGIACIWIGLSEVWKLRRKEEESDEEILVLEEVEDLPRRSRQDDEDDFDEPERDRYRRSSQGLHPGVIVAIVLGSVSLIGGGIWLALGTRKPQQQEVNEFAEQFNRPEIKQKFHPPQPKATTPAPIPVLNGRLPDPNLDPLKPKSPQGRPFAVDPRIVNRVGEGIHLLNLTEFDWIMGEPTWGLGKGNLGHPKGWVRFVWIGEKTSQNCICMHPPKEGYTRICYALQQSCSRLTGGVGINKISNDQQPAPTRFVILGDGKVLWQSKAIQDKQTIEPFDLDLASVDILELRVYTEGNQNGGSQGVWVDPYLFYAKGHDIPNPPKTSLFEVDPKMEKTKEKSIYLDELQEFDYLRGPWDLGKRGNLGSYISGAKVILKNRKIDHCLSMHPPYPEYTRVCYAIGQKASKFTGEVGFSDDEATEPNPVRFAIWGDNKLLWKSKLIPNKTTFDKFEVDVSQIKILELRVFVEGLHFHGSHAIWIDPKLKLK